MQRARDQHPFGEHVTRIDHDCKCVISKAGETPYDDLIIVPGSAPFIISVAGKDLPGVVTCRALEDTNAMIAAAEPGAKAEVIGGGLVGLKAAAGMQVRGAEVVVIHIMSHLLERQLDLVSGCLQQKSREARGMRIHCKGATKAIPRTDRVEAVLPEDGTVYVADIVCRAVGTRTEVRQATDAHLETGRGMTVNDQMQTSKPAIWAAVECIEHNNNQLFGLVAPLYDQAKVLVKSLMAKEAAFCPVQTATKLKVTKCDLFSVGDVADGQGQEDIVFCDSERGLYKRLAIEGNHLVGAVMYGDTADGNWFFGPAHQGGAQSDPLAAVAALPRDAEICGCNGVCKGKIVDAVAGGAASLDAVRATTKASSSCGTCTGLVEQILAVTLGDAFVRPTSQPMCKCTHHTHVDVRRLIKSSGLKSILAAMHELGWKTPVGWHSCRPALNYYRFADWPTEYHDDRQSRFVKERNHANIHKDGTHSVVPRMRGGGVTTPAELCALADAADRYNMPMVKVTGGQRIDLLGLKKQGLPAIWAELHAVGMVSGHACSKGLRKVKTCAGSAFCRFGTQD